MSLRYELYTYRDIQAAHGDALLAGNGLSISFSPRFSYGSLFQAAVPGMERTVTAIFEALGTTNFELALREVNQAIALNGLVGNDSGRLPEVYADIRQSLVRVVQRVHPEKTDIDTPSEDAPLTPTGRKHGRLAELGLQFARYGAIFTTSYDLIPYWAILTSPSSFKDFYFEACTFSPHVPEQYIDRIPLYFLHGALHLYTADGFTRKIVAESRQLTLPRTLDQLYRNREALPLFVSEGRSRHKLSRILDNEYLSFCYEALKRKSGGLTVFGLSLDGDTHIVDAVRESGIARIAVGIYTPGLNPEQIVLEQARYASKLGGDRELVFFDSATFGR